MTYIIEKISEQLPQPDAQPALYAIKQTKEVTTLEGEKVVVIDEGRIEQTTKEQLEAQKVSYQNAIKDIDVKLAEIEKIK